MNQTSGPTIPTTTISTTTVTYASSNRGYGKFILNFKLKQFKWFIPDRC